MLSTLRYILNYKKRRELLTPKRIAILRFMIDGTGIPDCEEPLFVQSYGGTGGASVNMPGGFGFDSIVRKMIEKGEVTFHRTPNHHNAHGGNETINFSYVKVTQKGREVYAKWKKKNLKRI